MKTKNVFIAVVFAGLFTGNVQAQTAVGILSFSGSGNAGCGYTLIVTGFTTLDAADKSVISLTIAFTDNCGNAIATDNVIWTPPTPGTSTTYSGRTALFVVKNAGQYNVKVTMIYSDGGKNPKGTSVTSSCSVGCCETQCSTQQLIFCEEARLFFSHPFCVFSPIKQGSSSLTNWEGMGHAFLLSLPKKTHWFDFG